MAVKLAAAIALAAGLVVLTVASSTAGAARGVPHRLGGLVPHIAHASRFASRASHVKRTAPLNCVSACSSYESTINQYFTDVATASAANATDNVYSVATQYSSIEYNVTFDAATNAYVDGSPFPTTKTCSDGYDKYCVTDQQLETEIGKVIAAKKWPVQSTTALYFIFTPANVGVCQYAGTSSNTNPCTTNAFCAYHSASNTFVYAVEPDAAAVSGGACDPQQAPAGNGADATINTISHEQMEAITDPLLTAWYTNDANGFEIGDLCAYDFGTPSGVDGTQYNQTINTHNYFLQLEYSNQDGGCVPYLGGTVTAPDPLLGDGSGPLVYDTLDAGPVMTTNTIYAIYWVPAAPVNGKLPAISGAAKVGKKLRASHGTWLHVPKYTYRWLRCSAAGTACKGITKATRSSYTLTKADARHRIEVRVTATNAVGSASATSAPTAVVKR